MKVTRTGLAGAAIALAAICVLLFLKPRTQYRQIEISYVALQAALDEELYRSPEVGIIPRVRFNEIRVRFDDGVVFESSGNWFSLGAGGFTFPDVSVVARLPTAADVWSVSEGTLDISRVEIIRTYREPYESIEGREEVVTNERGWGNYLAQFLQRLDIFHYEDLASKDWRVVSVQPREDMLIISLED